MKKIRVALDKNVLTSGHSVRGIGVHSKELIDSLLKLKIKDMIFESVDFSKANLSTFDVVHYPYFHPFFVTLPFRPPTKTVVTIHDLLPLIYPKNYPPGIRGKLRFQIQKVLVKQIDSVITISETSKKDIVRFLGVNEKRVNVIYLAPKSIYRKLKHGLWENKIQKKYELPDKFVLYVGDVNYNKNLKMLADVCTKLKLSLVVVGKQAASEDFDKSHIENLPLVSFLEAHKNNPLVKRVGFVPDEDLVKIYNLATVYCQPSFYEGFGLPVVEAMACGTPVVSSKTQALVEVGGDSAIYFDPKDERSLASTIKTVINDSSILREYSRRGLENVKRFSWKKTVDQTVDLYRKTATV